MTFSIRRLHLGDEAIVARLAEEDADYDVDERGETLDLLSPEDTRAYLADPNVLHWIAEEGVPGGRRIAGHMVCHHLRMRAGTAGELVLYEIGVHKSARRRGVGRALVEAALEWMKQQKMKAIWVLADNPGAIDFYRACGFSDENGTAVYMLREE